LGEDLGGAQRTLVGTKISFDIRHVIASGATEMAARIAAPVSQEALWHSFNALRDPQHGLPL